MSHAYQRRHRVNALMRAYAASRNAARACEARGELHAAQAAWEHNLVVWAELQGYGVDADTGEATRHERRA